MRSGIRKTPSHGHQRDLARIVLHAIDAFLDHRVDPGETPPNEAGRHDEARVGQPLLHHQRRAHGRDDGHRRVIAEVGGIHQPHDGAVAVEAAEVEKALIRAAAAASAENPGPDGE
jgi:hypothetical protein